MIFLLAAEAPGEVPADLVDAQKPNTTETGNRTSLHLISLCHFECIYLHVCIKTPFRKLMTVFKIISAIEVPEECPTDIADGQETNTI